MRSLCLLMVCGFAVVSCNSGPLTTIVVASGFDFPTFMAPDPTDSTRFFVTEKSTGLVRVVVNGQVLPAAFLDLSDKVEGTGFEQGLFAIAFHPDFDSNGFFYLSYTSIDNGSTVFERYQVSSDPNIADPDSAFLILEVEQPQIQHNGGMIAFGPKDGYLYLSTGDGGFVPFDPLENAQLLDNPLGKILRIDVDAAEPFAIPPTNPFVGVDGADEKIWAYGLRNPWRFSFDRETGDMYIGDVGQFAGEEVDYQPFDSAGGENYGWPIAEGFACEGGFDNCGTNPGLTPPIHAYGHILLSSSVTGGYVYRGAAIPGLRGTYFFGDFISGSVHTLRVVDGEAMDVTNQSLDLRQEDGSFPNISSFAQDNEGELYIVDFRLGRIHKIVPDLPEPIATELARKIAGLWPF